MNGMERKDVGSWLKELGVKKEERNGSGKNVMGNGGSLGEI